jgi:F-type H+-transporting ATPase subunit b
MTIDWWTLGFQTVNVLVLMWLLQHFFWRPVAAIIALRATTAQKAIDDAKANDAKAKAGLADIAKTRDGFAKERQTILDDAHKTGEDAHAARLAEAEKEVAALAESAKAQAAKDAAAAEKMWMSKAGKLAVIIATKLLSGLDETALHAAFLDRLLRQVHDAKQPIAPDGTALEVVSAAALDPHEQTKISTALHKALKTKSDLTFKVDASLIAGLELHAPHTVVSNSLHADLDRVLLELSHDDKR